MDKFNIIVIIILILIVLGEGLYGGYKTSEVGVECDIGLMEGKFCWVWKSELKQEIVAGEQGQEGFYKEQGYVMKEDQKEEKDSGCGCGS